MSSVLRVAAAEVPCSKCKAPLLPAYAASPDLSACPACRSPITLHLFPALFQRGRLVGSRGEESLVEGESTCFYHARKKAIVPCDYCGRFLCTICDVEMEGQHWCPQCLEAAAQQNRLPALVRRRTLHDSIALSLAILPLLLFLYPSFFGAPAAMFVAIYYRNAPTSLLGRTRVRSLLAITLAGLEILGWLTLIFILISTIRDGG